MQGASVTGRCRATFCSKESNWIRAPERQTEPEEIEMGRNNCITYVDSTRLVSAV